MRMAHGHMPDAREIVACDSQAKTNTFAAIQQEAGAVDIHQEPRRLARNHSGGRGVGADAGSQCDDAKRHVPSIRDAGAIALSRVPRYAPNRTHHAEAAENHAET